MPDKYDAMSNEELAAATLEMMGYEKSALTPWWYRADKSPDESWGQHNALSEANRHTFAAEVKQFMMSQADDEGCGKWCIKDEWFDKKTKTGYIEFMRDNIRMGTSVYFDMAIYPCAVCVAALRAMKTEKDA